MASITVTISFATCRNQPETRSYARVGHRTDSEGILRRDHRIASLQDSCDTVFSEATAGLVAAVDVWGIKFEHQALSENVRT